MLQIYVAKIEQGQAGAVETAKFEGIFEGFVELIGDSISWVYAALCPCQSLPCRHGKRLTRKPVD